MLLCTAGISLMAVRLLPEAAERRDADIRLTVLADGELRETTMAEYLPGVVAAEMPASFAPEALKAQAVAARTYILRRAAQRADAHPEADVCSDPGCCCAWSGTDALKAHWGGDYRKNLRTIRTAAAETDGQTLTYGGEPILAAFHSASHGRTESSEAIWGGALPYLVSVSTPETEADVPGMRSQVVLSPDEARTALADLGTLPEDPQTWQPEITPDEAGRVRTLTIGGVTLSGTEARARFHLRSALFTAEIQDGALVFTVDGSGHGVGMSQYGANVMAQAGAGYEEILAHYYPGAELSPAVS